MRPLTAEEAQLWAKVAATIRPLSRDKASEPPIEMGPSPAKTASKVAVGRLPISPPTPTPPAKPTTIQDGGLDSHWDRRLRNGNVRPDRVIDLHGHNLDKAWRAIDDGLEQAIEQGDRVILLITGHARAGEPPVQRGKIRAAVHDWLGASRHAGQIAAVRGASKRHGGGGSLYLILRR